MKPLWKPDPKNLKKTHLWQFLEKIQKKYDLGLSSPAKAQDPSSLYEALHRWSVKYPEFFWEEMWKEAEVIHSAPYKKVIDRLPRPIGPRNDEEWFPEAKLNFAENLLRYRDDHTALIYENEEGLTEKMSYAELYEQVQLCAFELKAAGVEVGDRVASLLPNCIEAVVAMLATTSLGAVWSSCSPDFGVSGILDRFTQIQPKILFATEDYTYGGKKFDIRDKLQKVAQALDFVICHSESRRSLGEGGRGIHIFKKRNIDPSGSRPQDDNFVQLPFNHPVYILYSSGTTGIPKCIVHGAGGTLLQHVKELKLHTSIDRNDTVFYYTTCGWMMWNWLVSSLALGATVVLYDGSAVYPTADRLWQLAEKHKVSVFGASPKYFSACERMDSSASRPLNDGKERLRCILSTGSPLPPEQFAWIYKNVKSDVQLSSICGGTDIVSCFMLGNPIVPVYKGEIQCIGLGMDVHVYDENGDEVPTGTKGELVCKTPFPSMPISFWNDPTGEKYKKSYFDYFPGVWRHGDFIEITEHGGVIVYGRSDATLNPGGVRIGTAEIYRVVESHPDVVDSVVIGHDVDHDVEIILFVVLKNKKILTEELKKELLEKIKSEASPKHKPKKIFQVLDIPRTMSGKKVELAVSAILHGREVKNIEAIANPEALEQFKKFNY